MYILKNAIVSITRNKGRNVLIGIIVLVIACCSTITLAIKNTATSLINSYKDAYQVEATIGFNRQNMKEQFDFTNKEGMDDMKENFNNISSLTVDEIKEYADSSYVKDYYYTVSKNVETDIELVSSDFDFEKRDNEDDMPNNKPNMNQSFTLTGYSNISSMEEFINGNYSLIESDENIWDLIFEGNYCLVNSELASLNELELNDTITIDDQEFTIIGIFEENDETNFSMFSNSANNIITNANAVSDPTNVTPTFILNSYDDVSSFQEELYSKGMNEFYTLTTNEQEVLNATSSVNNVATFALTFLILTLIIGAIVLFVINQINIRERKYEIGVLRTIGMKKSLLTVQFVLELSIVAFVALLLGCGIGTILSKPVGNMLLSNEIENSQNSMNEINNNFGGRPNKPDINGVVNVEAFDSIDAVVDYKVVLELLLIGISLTLVSSISSMISIQKFSPLQILKERS